MTDASGIGTILDDDGPAPVGTKIAAAGDIACDPSSGSFNGGQGVGLECRQRATLGPAGRRRLPGGARARRHPVRERDVLEVRRVVRPVLGAREGDHPSRAREPRVPDLRRGRLLPVLRRGGGRSGQGLLQLRPRRLASDRAQLELLRRRAAAAPARHRSSGSGPISPPMRRRPARSRTGTTLASPPASTEATRRTSRSGRRCTTRTPTSSSSGTTTTTSGSPRRLRAACSTRARDPPVRLRFGREERADVPDGAVRTARPATCRASVSSSSPSGRTRTLALPTRGRLLHGRGHRLLPLSRSAQRAGSYPKLTFVCFRIGPERRRERGAST